MMDQDPLSTQRSALGTVATLPIEVTVNGKRQAQEVEPRLLLVHYLRDTLGLTGTHVGCDTSQCGACTMLVDGEAVKSCTLLAVQVDGSSVTTIEGLAQGDRLHAVQEGFWERHGLQCGFCTPGILMTATFFLEQNPSPTEEEVRYELAGNLCRCTGYQPIVDSILAAAEKLRSGG